jgi:hypothetical protein
MCCYSYLDIFTLILIYVLLVNKNTVKIKP